MNLLDLMERAFKAGDGREFAVARDRFPSLKVAGEYKTIAREAASESDILELLVSLGGITRVDGLGAQPTSWKVVDDTLGALQVTAARRGGVLQARVVLPGAPAPPPRAPLDESRGAGPAREPAPSSAGGSLDLEEIPDVLRPARAVLELESAPASASRVISAAPPAETLDPRTLERWLAESRLQGASDLHIVAARPVLMRIGGDLRPTGPALLPSDVEQMLLARIPAHLLAGFHRDGSCDFAIEQAPYGRFRVNISRQRTGLKGSFRLIGSETPTLEGLGLPAAIAGATHHHQGLIVVTGPTGHGKTSTLAAIVNLMNTETKHHIITVEDPIEYLHVRKKALITQREVGTHTRSFASALKASLREDPEVIVVGELRDTETVRMALAASETGHLVVATMNTPSAAKTIDRLIDLFPPGDQPQVRMGLAGGLRLIVSQRLVRGADGTRVFAAAELLPGNVALWNLIRENKTYQIPSLQQRGKSLGIIRLDDSLIDLVRAGKVTLDAARAAADAPDEVTAAITGQRSAASIKRGS